MWSFYNRYSPGVLDQAQVRQVELSLPPGVEISHLCHSPLTPLVLLICLCIWPVSLRLGGWFLLIWMPGTYTLHQAVEVLSVVYLPQSEICPCNSLLEGKLPLHTVVLHKPEKLQQKKILLKYINLRIFFKNFHYHFFPLYKIISMKKSDVLNSRKSWFYNFLGFFLKNKIIFSWKLAEKSYI